MNPRTKAAIFAVVSSLITLAACAFVNSGEIVVTETEPGRTATETEDSVVQAIVPVLDRYGFKPVWIWQRRSDPCTSNRGCTWAPEGKGWRWPRLAVLRSSSGRVRVRIEARHDSPTRDNRVEQLTEQVAVQLRTELGEENVTVKVTNPWPYSSR